MYTKLAVFVLTLSVFLVIPANADLVGEWKFDETEGTIAPDTSGGGNDGILFGDLTWIVQGWFDGALAFGGGNGYVELPIGQLISELTESTLSIWVNWSGQGGNWQRIIDFGSGTTNYIYVTPFSGSSELRVAIVTAATAAWNEFNSSEGTLATGWHHIAVTISDEDAVMIMYLDGEEVGRFNNMLHSLDDLGVTNQNWLGRSQYEDPYFQGEMDHFQIYNEVLSQDEVKTVMGIGFLAEGFAVLPSPQDGQTDVDRDGTVLSWLTGFDGAVHDVYFGSSLDDVRNADKTNPLGVLVSENQSGTTYALDRLELGQTYYWRVDEVNNVNNEIFQGLVWSFTVEPVSYPLPSEAITATASTTRDGTSAESTIDGSGLDENDGHSTMANDMWLSVNPDDDPWIQYEFDGVYKLDRMLVWNANQLAEGTIGWGVKDVQIETSLDGTSWTVVDGITQLAQAPGSPGAGPTDTFDLGGITAKYVRFSIASGWTSLPTIVQYSLSEVRFYYLRVQATQPVPASGATGIHPTDILGWRAGREAGTHEVFVDMDANAVLDGSASSDTVADNSFGLASLDLPLGETYFWKVNEVNDAEDPSVWEGPLWSFSIPDPLVVDDFESYNNDIPSRPYVTWRDGLPYSNPAPGDEGNGTGAIVGHDIFSPGSPYFDGDLMELSLVHGGSQSLPLYYDNSGNGGDEPYSEMTRTFSPAQDWSGNAIATLTLYFRGMEGNSGQLYVKINNTKILFTDDPGALSRPMWEQWNIDLASTGANLSSVQSFSIGIENAGSGLVHIDDIFLYSDAPAVVEGVDPGNAGLVASYSMENNVNDGTGNYNGTTIGNPGYVAGPSGMALALDGVDDYVELPIGSLLASLSDITVASWVNFSGEGGPWQRVFDFGTDTTNYMFLTTSSGSATMRVVTLTPDVGGESIVDGLATLPTDWHHVAATIDSSTMNMTLYLDGSVVGSGPTEVLPQDLGETTQNWLGRSQFEADAFYNGALDEFLIFDRALSEAEVRYLAGEQ